MRFKWRKWLNFDCNWKVAMEAFNETYHVFTTHPEFNKFGEFKGWAKAQGRHSNIGYDAPKGLDETKSKIRLGTGDPRISTAEMQVYTMEETNATTTQTLVERRQASGRRTAGGHARRQGARALADLGAQRRRRARRRLADDPRGHPRPERHRVADLPQLPDRSGPDQRAVLQRPPRSELHPDKCIFEVAVFELYPKGEEPQTEWVYTPVGDPNWLSVLPQDFSNMAAVQQGMKSLGLPRHQAQPVPRTQHRQPALPAVEVHGHRRPQDRDGTFDARTCTNRRSA